MTRIEWDPVKDRSNKRKHGIAFDLAQRVFEDPEALVNHDRIEGGERRWQTLGMVGGVLLVLVAHTIDFAGAEDEIIRIISPRAADAKEKRRYEKAREENRWI